MSITEIKNEHLTVAIDTKGAELRFIRGTNGVNYLWEGNPVYWANRAPVLFPVAGGLKEDRYIFKGKEYHMPKHGYARTSEFRLKGSGAYHAEFILEDNEESRKIYPFKYELRIMYRLVGNRIDVSYEVINKSDTEMYFSVGAHEGYSCPEGIDEYVLMFPEDVTLATTVLDGNLIKHGKEPVIRESSVLPLKYDYFNIDALVFEDVPVKSVVLKHLKSTKKIKVDFDGFKNLLFWTKPGAPYICIEPWCGKPDFVDSALDIALKPSMNRLEPAQKFIRTHSITAEGGTGR